MIESILPETVVSVEADEGAAFGHLFGDEEQLVASAVEKRRREFTAGRTCAHAALAALGFPTRPLLRGTSGEPLWPTGAVGSITHCEGYVAAVAARQSDVIALGIDAERHRPLEGGVEALVCNPAERDWCHAQDHAVHWSTLIFSAKEAFYKAWFPLGRRVLDFADAEVSVCADDATFTVRLLTADSTILAARSPLLGRFVVSDGHVIAALAVSA